MVDGGNRHCQTAIMARFCVQHSGRILTHYAKVVGLTLGITAVTIQDMTHPIGPLSPIGTMGTWLQLWIVCALYVSNCLSMVIMWKCSTWKLMKHKTSSQSALVECILHGLVNNQEFVVLEGELWLLSARTLRPINKIIK